MQRKKQSDIEITTPVNFSQLFREVFDLKTGAEIGEQLVISLHSSLPKAKIDELRSYFKKYL